MYTRGLFAEGELMESLRDADSIHLHPALPGSAALRERESVGGNRDF